MLSFFFEIEFLPISYFYRLLFVSDVSWVSLSNGSKGIFQ